MYLVNKKIYSSIIAALLTVGVIITLFMSSDTPSAVPLKTVSAQYPQEALDKKIEGWVTVSGEIDSQGLVTHLHVVDSKPKGIFDDYALTAVQQWTFKSDGPKQFNFQLDFNLQ